MFVYGGDDIVSNSLKSPTPGWEGEVRSRRKAGGGRQRGGSQQAFARKAWVLRWRVARQRRRPTQSNRHAAKSARTGIPTPSRPHPTPQEIEQMLYAMKMPVPASPEDLAHPSRWKVPASPFVLDIGANIGWFMINAAAHGATVAAFEGRLPWRAAGCGRERSLSVTGQGTQQLLSRGPIPMFAADEKPHSSHKPSGCPQQRCPPTSDCCAPRSAPTTGSGTAWRSTAPALAQSGCGGRCRTTEQLPPPPPPSPMQLLRPLSPDACRAPACLCCLPYCITPVLHHSRTALPAPQGLQVRDGQRQGEPGRRHPGVQSGELPLASGMQGRQRAAEPALVRGRAPLLCASGSMRGAPPQAAPHCCGRGRFPTLHACRRPT
jgi:hypothetical protein